jgi:phenylacetate-CoA ligase
VSYPTYFDAADVPRLLADYPLGPNFATGFRQLSRDALRARQEIRFATVMRRAWQIAFYRRRWQAVGLEPGDIRGLDDIGKLPVYAKSDLMQSIAEHPPWGDFHGLEAWPVEARPPVVLHTTSGTTGRPQVLLFGPKSRFQGMRPGDVVHSVYGHGMVNGGHYVRETVLHFTNAMFLSAGTGIETRSHTHVELMRDFGATVLVGFADYIRRLAEVAREQDILPGRDIKIRMISGHLGRENRDAVGQAWGGAELFDWYGVGDTGIIAGEGPDHAGLYVMEDAQYIELLDPETGAPVPDGAAGNLVVTCLYKDDVYPIIRFNTNDLTAFESGASPLGLNLRRIQGFLGRSDNMVKLRGINIYPTAIAAWLVGRSDTTGEYLCRVVRDPLGRDDMTVTIELAAGVADSAARRADLKALLKQRLGVEVGIELVAAGRLAPLTGLESRQKPIRLIDDRFAKP